MTITDLAGGHRQLALLRAGARRLMPLEDRLAAGGAYPEDGLDLTGRLRELRAVIEVEGHRYDENLRRGGGRRHHRRYSTSLTDATLARIDAALEEL